ncbi:hypothetical protein J2T16_001290 [Paenibacillus intestini]|nr:hypothetical protein [Paenibacillus intestini]
MNRSIAQSGGKYSQFAKAYTITVPYGSGFT